LLWEEYRQANPDGYQYSRFCDLYQGWRRKQDFVLRQEHKAGEKAHLEWTPSRMPENTASRTWRPTKPWLQVFGKDYYYTSTIFFSSLLSPVLSNDGRPG
jgi:hypothetical protein